MPEPPAAMYPPQPEPLPEDGMPLPPPPPEPPSDAGPEGENIGMVRDSVQTFVTSILNIIISLASSIILSRAIAPIGKGLFAILILIPKSAWSFGTFGLDQVNTVYAGREPERRHELATTTLVLGFAISFVLYAAVAIALYWPGHGAARVGIEPGDFIILPNAQSASSDDESPLFNPSGEQFEATVWRNGVEFPKSIPVEAGRPDRQVKDFRISAVNSWKYGLQGNPLFRSQYWVPGLNAGVLPLSFEVLEDLREREEAGRFSPDAIEPDPLGGLLVTQVGEGGRLSKLKRLGKPGPPLKVGDILKVRLYADHTLIFQDPMWPLLKAGPNDILLVRDGEEMRVTVDIPADLADDVPVVGPLNMPQRFVRAWGLGRNLLWQDMVDIPRLGMAVVPLTEERWADLQARQAVGLFAQGVALPASRDGAYLITQVHASPLRRWSQDLPTGLFMLTMLFFPLTVTAYLMDSILYGLNLIKLKNQKTIWTSLFMAILNAGVLWGYGVSYLGLSNKDPEELIHLLWIAVYATLVHGFFIQLYSYYLIRTRAELAWRHFNLPYVVRGFSHIGWQAYIANSASYLFYDIDVLIIKQVIDWGTTPLTLDNLGNYTQATNIIERVWIIPGAIASALLPKLTNFGEAKTAELTPKSVRHTLLLTIAILLPLCVALPFLVPILWGPEFLPLLGPFYCLAPGVVLFSTSKVYSAHLLGIGKPKYAMTYSLITVVVNVVLNYAFIPLKTVVWGVPLGGMNGAALASTVAYSLHSLLMMFAYTRESGLTPGQIFRFTVDDWRMYGRGWNMLVGALRRRMGRRAGLSEPRA